MGRRGRPRVTADRESGGTASGRGKGKEERATNTEITRMRCVRKVVGPWGLEPQTSTVSNLTAKTRPLALSSRETDEEDKG